MLQFHIKVSYQWNFFFEIESVKSELSKGIKRVPPIYKKLTGKHIYDNPKIIHPIKVMPQNHGTKMMKASLCNANNMFFSPFKSPTVSLFSSNPKYRQRNKMKDTLFLTDPSHQLISPTLP